jgi:hypothetical protein
VETGIQFKMVPGIRRDDVWIPVFTGMTIRVLRCSHAHGRLRSNLKGRCTKYQPTISQTQLRLKPMGNWQLGLKV